MLNLQGLKVDIFNSDVAPMVLSLTMYETIKGNIRGSMTLLDNVNFMDVFLGTTHAPIKITWAYQGDAWINHFYGDGIEKVEIMKSGKQYTIHFVSYATLNEHTKMINNVYSGTSDQIIHNIFKEACGDITDAPFITDSIAVTKGRYIVPNITANKAISNVLNSSYDEAKSGLFLYQRVCEQNITRLSSLNYMDTNFFYRRALDKGSVKETMYTLKAAVAGASAEDQGIDPAKTIGTTPGFIVDEYNMNFTAKLAQGTYGQKVQNIELDKTSSVDFEPVEIDQKPKTSFPLSTSLYEDNAKSVFSTSCGPEAYFAANQKRRAYNQRVTAPDVIAVPGLGCGYSIGIEQGGSNLSNNHKTDTKYIIANITHKFVMSDGKHRYTQDIGLIRE